jgi:hypothetical protein
VAPDVARDLRRAAEYATQERRITGGLLYGRRWADDEGPYLVVDGFLESDNRRDRISGDGHDAFTLPAEDLVPLRRDADRMYSAAAEVGWWRTLEGPGEFSPRDFETQRELVRTWRRRPARLRGRPRLGNRLPGARRAGPRFGPVVHPGATARSRATATAGAGPGPGRRAGRRALSLTSEPVTAAAPGTALATRRQSTLTPAPQPAGPRVIGPRSPSRRRSGESSRRTRATWAPRCQPTSRS